MGSQVMKAWNNQQKQDVQILANEISLSAHIHAEDKAKPIVNQDNQQNDAGAQNGIMTHTRQETARPRLYKVLMLNDDYTPMEFVVHALQNFFDKNESEATEIMLNVHTQGVGICGVFTLDVADTKIRLVTELARSNGHPLMCSLEKA